MIMLMGPEASIIDLSDRAISTSTDVYLQCSMTLTHGNILLDEIVTDK
jgi:hypothetical protein